MRVDADPPNQSTARVRAAPADHVVVAPTRRPLINDVHHIFPTLSHGALRHCIIGNRGFVTEQSLPMLIDT
jgi:hypothetical protein